MEQALRIGMTKIGPCRAHIYIQSNSSDSALVAEKYVSFLKNVYFDKIRIKLYESAYKSAFKSHYLGYISNMLSSNTSSSFDMSVLLLIDLHYFH